MKQTIPFLVKLIIFIFLSRLAVAQTQRIELFEEFTGERCGPCASINPELTRLIESNQSPQRKIVLLRYQCAIPSAPGPGSLYQDNTVEVNNRQSYYSVPFAPYGRLDGVEIPSNGQVSAGNASLLTQAVIDSAYQVNAPFLITLTHVYNAAGDSMVVNVTVTAKQNYTPAGSLKLQCALTEEYIHFKTPPGSNGEKDFEFVMRKMIPAASGTALTSGNWSNGQSQSFTLKTKIPAYIKDKTQIAIVAFVQDDGNKKVLNTSYSEPIPVPYLDVSIESVLNKGIVGCITNYAPLVRLKNTGTPVINSAKIYYSFDNGTLQNYQYTGSIASGAATTINLPAFNVPSPGPHNFYVKVMLPNGQTDKDTLRDIRNEEVFTYSNPLSLPFSESFTNASPFPANSSWLVNDVSKFGRKWKNSLSYYPALGGSATGGGAAWIDAAWIWKAGVTNELCLPLIKTGNDPVLSFYVAAAPMENSGIPNEKFEVWASKDCGASWQTVYSKSGAAFYTHAAHASFKPAISSDWRKETVSLSGVKNSNEVLLKFVSICSGSTNNIFLDDINISNTVGINEYNADASIQIGPNPANNLLNIYCTDPDLSNAVDCEMINAIGQSVLKTRIDFVSGSSNISLDELPVGVYHILFTTVKGFRQMMKLSVVK